MATRRQSRGRSRSSGPRRRTIWEAALTDPAVVAAGGQSVVDLTENFRVVAGSAERAGVTILRMIGQIITRPSVAGANIEYAMGIAMVQEDAAQNNTFPDPTGDFGFPWLWFLRDLLYSAAIEAIRIPIDVKSRRRFRGDDERCYLIIDNDDPMDAMEVTVGIRVLYALP